MFSRKNRFGLRSKQVKLQEISLISAKQLTKAMLAFRCSFNKALLLGEVKACLRIDGVNVKEFLFRSTDGSLDNMSAALAARRIAANQKTQAKNSRKCCLHIS